ncbi:MAG TPA: divergent polysaccharide deacetylase family protein [Candidatus Eisenbacteria bacterium]|nr:divergent polysaccharide deacetylase family protein [Candidatus Eisenbacteria bacterium]
MKRGKGRGQGGLIAGLALAVILVFAAGEIILFARSEEGSVYLAQHGFAAPRSRLALSVETTIRGSLHRLGLAAGNPEAKPIKEEGGKVVRWAVDLPARASLFLVNAEVTKSLEDKGERVFDGWETAGKDGETLTLRVGVGQTVTHELDFTRKGGDDAHEVVRLAIVIEGFGPADNDSLAKAAIGLPFDFSGAVITNEKGAKHWAQQLASHGREVVAQIPMEPMNYPARSPGPDAVLVDMTKSQIRRLVVKHVHAAPGCIAALPYLGGMALQDANAMQAVATELHDQKIAYVEVSGEEHSVGLESASRAGVPFLRLDTRVDAGHGSASKGQRAVHETLRDLADTARRRGFATGIARLDRPTLMALRTEVPALENQGVHVVPLSALLRPSVY